MVMAEPWLFQAVQSLAARDQTFVAQRGHKEGSGPLRARAEPVAPFWPVPISLCSGCRRLYNGKDFAWVGELRSILMLGGGVAAHSSSSKNLTHPWEAAAALSSPPGRGVRAGGQARAGGKLLLTALQEPGPHHIAAWGREPEGVHPRHLPGGEGGGAWH